MARSKIDAVDGPSAKADARHEKIKGRMAGLAQKVLGLPVVFTLRDVAWMRSYRVEVSCPTGFRIDIGFVMFDPDSGGLVYSPRSGSPALTQIVSHMDPDDLEG